MPFKFRSTHLIEEYKVRENTVLCCCGWFGDADNLRVHQITAKPTSLKPSVDPYAVTSFNRSLNNTPPDYFDYVQEKAPLAEAL